MDLKFEIRRGLKPARQKVCDLLDDLLERIQELEDALPDATKTVDRR